MYTLCKTVFVFLVLNGPGIDAEHCILESIEGHVTVHPLSTLCFVNGEAINEQKRLKQGVHFEVFRFCSMSYIPSNELW